MTDSNIVLGDRFGDIIFGMNKQDIINIVGILNKEYITDYDNYRLQYFDYKIELSLELTTKQSQWVIIGV